MRALDRSSGGGRGSPCPECGHNKWIYEYCKWRGSKWYCGHEVPEPGVEGATCPYETEWNNEVPS